MKECPWWIYHQPDDPVTIGTTTVGKDGQKSESKTIRYEDWEWRCKICYPIGDINADTSRQEDSPRKSR